MRRGTAYWNRACRKPRPCRVPAGKPRPLHSDLLPHHGALWACGAKLPGAGLGRPPPRVSEALRLRLTFETLAAPDYRRCDLPRTVVMCRKLCRVSRAGHTCGELSHKSHCVGGLQVAFDRGILGRAAAVVVHLACNFSVAVAHLRTCDPAGLGQVVQQRSRLGFAAPAQASRACSRCSRRSLRRKSSVNTPTKRGTGSRVFPSLWPSHHVE